MKLMGLFESCEEKWRGRVGRGGKGKWMGNGRDIQSPLKSFPG